MISSAYPSLASFFNEVYQPRRLLNCSPRTLEQYQIALRHFGRFLGRTPLVTDLDSDRIADFLAHLSSIRQANTVRNNRAMLVALATYAQKRGLLVEVPDVMPVRPLRRLPTSYTIEEISRLLAACHGVRGEIDGVPGRLFWSALFLVAYDTGARARAIWMLQWSNWTPPILVFRAETQKQKADQILRVSLQTVHALEAIRQPHRDLIFPWSKCQRLKSMKIKRIFKAGGLPHGRRDLLQRIRRTCATLMDRAGGDACRQLGHSSDAVTRASYLDPSHQPQAVDVLPRPIVQPEDRQQRLF